MVDRLPEGTPGETPQRKQRAAEKTTPATPAQKHQRAGFEPVGMSPASNGDATLPGFINAYIGIGSNLQDPLQQVLNAFELIAALPHSKLTKRSSCYFSDPVGPGQQPDYVNAVAGINTTLSATQLLEQLQHIEHTQGRTRHQRWEPRVLDLDILLYDNCEIQSERLVVPHPELKHRDFVLVPLLEIAPDLQLPDGTNGRQLLATCRSNKLRKINLDQR